ncbi:MAG: NAD(P)/FAD-dependent oxidoreductase [Verrucomicrobiota bacterium]
MVSHSQTSLPSTDYDAVVIGGGPAGSTASALLAEKGWNVVVIEKERFPRYHVGESLMPFCWHLLNRLGLVERMDELGFTQKFSVQFATPQGQVSKPFYFFEHYDHPSSTTWQVNRDEFDHLLLRNAAHQGAEVREGTKVTRLLQDETGRCRGVAVLGEEGEEEIRARIVVDASGRDAFAQSKLRWRERDPQLNKVAIWTYFENAVRDPGLDAGSTTVAYLPHGGWFWYIPLKDGRTSLGVVGERGDLFDGTRDPAEIMDRQIQDNDWIRDHLKGAQQVGQYWTTGEYSYRSRYSADDGLVLIGDAFAFLDPVFSSGVFLALKTGAMGADAIDAALQADDVSAERFARYSDEVCATIEKFRKIVYAFYDKEASFGKVIRKHPDLRPDLTDLLIGNVDKGGFKELFEGFSELMPLPADLEHGRPRTAEAVA